MDFNQLKTLCINVENSSVGWQKFIIFTPAEFRVCSARTVWLQSLGVTACYHLICIYYNRQNRNNRGSQRPTHEPQQERDAWAQSRIKSTGTFKIIWNPGYKKCNVGLLHVLHGRKASDNFLLKPRIPWNLESKRKTWLHSVHLTCGVRPLPK